MKDLVKYKWKRSNMKNNVFINSNQLKIEETQKVTSLWLIFIFVVLGLQSIFYWNTYLKSKENYDLLIAVFLSLLVLCFFIREYFFRNNKNSIDIDEIKKVSIHKVALEKDMVYLKIKLERKTRNILISNDKAIEIKQEMESLL